MNERTRRASRTTGRAALPRSFRAVAALTLPAALITGCDNPFRTLPSDYGDPIPRARLMEVDPIALRERHADAAETATLPPPLAQADRVELALDQARAYTLQNNLDLRVSLINPALAGQSLREQEAAWEAVFGIDARYTQTDQPTSDRITGSQIESQSFAPRVDIPLRTGGNIRARLPISSTRNNNAFTTTLNPAVDSDFEVSISQPLLRGGGREANTNALRVAAYQEGIELARTKLEVIRQLANADRSYWRLFAAIRALDVARQQYDLATTQFERARRLNNAGRTAEIEVVRAEEGIAQRLEAIIQASNAVKQQQRELKRIMNAPELPLEEFPLVWPATDPRPAPLELDATRLTSIALDQRMELLELELQLASDASVIALRENETLPLFTLDYTYRINGLGANVSESSSVLRRADFEDWSVGVTVETPIGNEGAKSRLSRAVIERLQRLSTREARRLAIEQEVRDAVDNIDAGWQRILAARQSAILAGRTLAAEERQFDVGRSTSTDVLDAATRLADSQLAEIRALADYQIAQVDLAFATGSVLGAALVEWEPLDPRPAQASEPVASQPTAPEPRPQ